MAAELQQKSTGKMLCFVCWLQHRYIGGHSLRIIVYI